MKFSQVTINNTPGALDYVMGVTAGNVDQRSTLTGLAAVLGTLLTGIKGGSLDLTSGAGGRLSYTNTGTGGGTGYYMNLGGIKICWGKSVLVGLGTSTGVSVSLPVGFFTSIDVANLHIAESSTGDGMVRQTGVATTSGMSGWFTSGGAANAALGWLVIGR